jgi:WD40 repeat protein
MYSRLPIAGNSRIQVGHWTVEIGVAERNMVLQFEICDLRKKTFPQLETRFIWGFSSNRTYGRDAVIGLPWVNLVNVKSSSDGRFAVAYNSGLPEGTVRLFDQTGSVLLERKFYWILDSSISPNGDFLAVSEVPKGGGGSVYLYDRKGGLVFKSRTRDGCYVAVTNQGQVFCAEQFKGGILSLDNTGQIIWMLEKQLDGITNTVALSISPSYLVVGTQMSVFLFSGAGKMLWSRSLMGKSATIGGGVIGADISSDGGVLVASSEDGRVHLLDRDGSIP